MRRSKTIAYVVVDGKAMPVGGYTRPLESFTAGRVLKLLVGGVVVYMVLFAGTLLLLPGLFSMLGASDHIASAPRDFWYGLPLVLTLAAFLVGGVVSWAFRGPGGVDDDDD